jgi:hypothetical protein
MSGGDRRGRSDLVPLTRNVNELSPIGEGVIVQMPWSPRCQGRVEPPTFGFQQGFAGPDRYIAGRLTGPTAWSSSAASVRAKPRSTSPKTQDGKAFGSGPPAATSNKAERPRAPLEIRNAQNGGLACPSMRTLGGEVAGGRWGRPPVRRELVGGVHGRLRCCTPVLYRSANR